MWLLSAILGMAMLLSCSGERTRVETGQPRVTEQTGSAVIEFSPPSRKLFLVVNGVNRSGLAIRLSSIHSNMPNPMSAIASTAPTVISTAGSIRTLPRSSA